MESRSNKVNFPSLTGIMERFQSVPFEQFQSEINDWFISSLSQKGIEIKNLSESDSLILDQLTDLTKSIYHQAEVLQTLVDFNIKPNDDEV